MAFDMLTTKTTANICAAGAQRAEMAGGAFLSAYWSATEGKPVPQAFIDQARDHIRSMVNLLLLLETRAAYESEAHQRSATKQEG